MFAVGLTRFRPTEWDSESANRDSSMTCGERVGAHCYDYEARSVSRHQVWFFGAIVLSAAVNSRPRFRTAVFLLSGRMGVESGVSAAVVSCAVVRFHRLFKLTGRWAIPPGFLIRMRRAAPSKSRRHEHRVAAALGGRNNAELTRTDLSNGEPKTDNDTSVLPPN